MKSSLQFYIRGVPNLVRNDMNKNILDTGLTGLKNTNKYGGKLPPIKHE
jgi:hypothetical protein